VGRKRRKEEGGTGRRGGRNGEGKEKKNE